MHTLSPLNRLIVAFVQRLWRFRRFRGRQTIIDRVLPLVRAIPSRYGPTIRVRRRDFTNRAAIFGAYGDEIVGWLGRLRPDDLFLDIGANAGIFSLVASQRLPRGGVFSFEPNPDLYADLRFNIAVNGARRIIPLNVALSERTGTFTLVHNPNHTGGAALSCHAQDGSLPPNAVEHVVLAVAPKDLGAVLDEARERRVCMKLDVEGHELAVLRGLQEAGILSRAAWAIVEIDAAHLARFGASPAMLYRLMVDEGFAPAKGCDAADHYDELFVRQPADGDGIAANGHAILQ